MNRMTVAAALLVGMGLASCNENEQPKPQAQGFQRLIHHHGLVATRCVMVEDSLDNLRTARRLGMKTVLVTDSKCAPAWVDVSVRHLFRLPRLLHRL